MRYRSRLAGVLVSLALLAGVSAVGVGGIGAQAAQRAMGANGPRCILGACRQIFASPRSQRMQRRRKPALIHGESGQKDARHWAGASSDMRAASARA